jgi:hypothetical protein
MAEEEGDSFPSFSTFQGESGPGSPKAKILLLLLLLPRIRLARPPPRIWKKSLELTVNFFKLENIFQIDRQFSM